MKINLLIEKIERNHHVIMLIILLMMLLSPLAYAQTPCNTELSETHTDVTCYGAMNGTITLSTTVPNGSLNYVWSDGNTNKDRTNLAPGTYTVSATDGEYCNANLTVTISEPSELLVTESHLASTCGGILTNVVVSATGGQTPYSYLWNDGDTNDERSQLSGGAYTVTVTDVGGCSKQLVLSNNNNVSFQFKFAKVAYISCKGMCDGALKVDAVMSTPPFFYQWSTGATTSSITGLCMGYYTVTVTNGLGCTAVKTHFFCGPNKLSAPFIKTEITAPGANDGTVTWSTKGGNQPYFYLWSDGYTLSNRTNIAAGKYTITVTDSRGCTTTKKIVWKNPLVQRMSSEYVEDNLSVSPNPSSDKFEINIDVNLKSEYDITILDANGRIVLNEKHELDESDHQLIIDMNQKPKGVYTLCISNSERRFIKKLVLI